MTPSRRRSVQLPWPILLVAGLIGLVFVLQVVSAIQPYLAIAAALLWAMLLIGVVYHAGYLPALGQAQALRPVLGFRLGPAAAGAGAARAPARASPTEDPAARARLAAEADAALGEVVGQAHALQTLRRYLVIADDACRRGRRALGVDRAAIFVVHGPPGTGKSLLARPLANLLYGHGAIAIHKIIDVQRPVGGLASAAPEKEWRARIEQSLDGVLLIDNADWLSDKDDLTRTPFAMQLLTLIDDTASRHPGKLCVILTATSTGPEVRGPDCLEGEPAARLLMRHSLFPVALVPLVDADMVALFKRQLAQRGLSLAAGADEAAERSLRRERQEKGPRHFDNAEAARRLAERAALCLAERRGDTISAADLRTAE